MTAILLAAVIIGAAVARTILARQRRRKLLLLGLNPAQLIGHSHRTDAFHYMGIQPASRPEPEHEAEIHQPGSEPDPARLEPFVRYLKGDQE